MSALNSGKTKLGTIIAFDNLPKDRNDNLWTEIRTNCNLTLDELSALKNAVSPPGNPLIKPIFLFTFIFIFNNK
jgi:hypothetical protein